jgi:arabinofuranan 3-O-arabinosyltransferase
MTVLTADRPTTAAPPPPRREPWSVRRAGPLAVSAVITVFCFLQAPGRIIADTKLDLALAPWDFLGRTLHLWEPRAAFGHIQNQAPGYLFPMGPFFALTHALHIPTWVAQRAWISLLLLLALWGTLRVAEALGIGTPRARLLGAAAYALSPSMLSVIGVASGTQLPAALVPWALLPLVRHTEGARPSRTAARSALVIAAMGGINGVATLAVLPLPLLYLLTQYRGRLRRQLLAWWLLFVVLATLWWTGPLVLQARFGFHFLDFTETARVTTSTSSAIEVTRGTGYWLSYFHLYGPWLHGGWDLIASPILILATSSLAALGLYGLAKRDLPARLFLGITAVLAVLVLTAGYAGPLASPLGPTVQSLLVGPLSALRNLNKFEPMLRLPLALALAHAVTVMGVSSIARRVGAAALLVVVAAAPMWQGHLVADGAFKQIPGYWRVATSWLAARSGNGRTLVVPSAAFGEYAWGRPLDEPMQALARSPWVVRDIVPLGSVGATRLLDTAERQLERGEPSPGLAAFLSRAGIRYVLVRNDLDRFRVNAPPPAYLRRALQASPGFRAAAAFGPVVHPVMTTDRLLPDLGPNSRAGIRSLEVYDLGRTAGPLTTYPQAGTLRIDGAPDALLAAAEAGDLGERAVVLSGDDRARIAGASIDVQTDAAQRRDDEFGVVRSSLSYPLTPSEPAPGTNQAPRQRLVVDHTPESTVRMEGAVAVEESSDEGTLWRAPERQPYAAFDGNPTTAWVSGSPKGPVDQWVRLRVADLIAPTTINVQLLADHPWRPRITSLIVSTEAGSVLQKVRATEEPQTVGLPPGRTHWIQLTIATVTYPLGPGGGAGLREVSVPGVRVDRTLALPPAPAGSLTAEILLSRSHADPYDQLSADEELDLRRIFPLSSEAQMQLSGTVLPAPGPALDRLIDANSPASALSVTTSSTWGGLPSFGAAGLVDGDEGTSWIASADDGAPSIHLRWPDVRTLDTVQVRASDGPVLRPMRIRLQSGLAVRDVDVGAGDVVRFEPLRTNDLTVTPLATIPTLAAGDASRLLTPLAVGIAELRFPALADLQQPRDSARPIQLACGAGPAVHIDGATVATSVHGTVGDLLAMRPLQLTSCAPDVRLAAGEHRLTAGREDGLVLTSAVLRQGALPPSSVGRRAVAGAWGSESREATVGPGPASYLALSENFNDGWTASLRGERLQPIRLDGWRQAWVLPAGTGGTVRMVFTPGHQYRAALLAGVVAVVVLLGLAFGRRRPAAVPVDPSVPTRRRVSSALAPSAIFVGAVILGGAFGGAVAAVLLVVTRLVRVRLPALAGIAFAVAGLAVVLRPGAFAGSGAGAFGMPAQACALVAIIAVAVSLVTEEDTPLIRRHPSR